MKSRKKSNFLGRRLSVQQMIMTNQFDDSDKMACCFYCFKILELYQQRHNALVFKTDSTMDELRKMRGKPVSKWTEENINYVISIYKTSKKVFSVMRDSDLQNTKRFITRARSLSRKKVTFEIMGTTSQTESISPLIIDF